jgi:hypothetical protein
MFCHEQPLNWACRTNNRDILSKTYAFSAIKGSTSEQLVGKISQIWAEMIFLSKHSTKKVAEVVKVNVKPPDPV